MAEEFQAGEIARKIIYYGSFAIAAVGTAAFFAYPGIKASLRKRAASSALKKMEVLDPAWSETELLNIARRKFLLIQKAYNSRDLAVLKEHLSGPLYEDWKEDLSGEQGDEQDPLVATEIIDAAVYDVKNYGDESRDNFTIIFDCYFKGDPSSRTRETWTFEKSGKTWVLRSI